VQLERGVPELRRDRRDQGAGALRGEDSRRVLHVDAVDIGALAHLTGEVGVEGVVVHRADRERQRADHLVDAGPLEAAGGGARGVHVVHRVEHDHPVDSVGDQPVVDELHRLRVRVLP
jgi:hypothetical protein